VRHELRRNSKVSIALQRISAQGYLILVGFELFTQKLLPYVKTTTIYLLLAGKVVRGEMTLGTTVPMISYLGRLAFPIERIVNFACWIWQTMVSAERMMQILETKPSIQDKDHAVRLPAITGSIELEGVTFERDGIGVVLNDVSLKIAPGKTLAIVGPSGAGKSTIVSLLLRLVDPKSGTVRVDGHDLRDVNRDSYLHQIGIVNQETFLFAGSVLENLMIANPKASEDQIWAVLAKVKLDEWVRSLPNKLDEDLDSGNGLSMGQKQRIGIARALLSDAKVLILDEPTSALDVHTEQEIIETIREISESRAVVIVTHRLQTIEYADQVIVLDQGSLVEAGTHAELLAMGGLYERLSRIYKSNSLNTVMEAKGALTS
jgi:ABC-type multidrug transport system fused ATPase/permease subunit